MRKLAAVMIALPALAGELWVYDSRVSQDLPPRGVQAYDRAAGTNHPNWRADIPARPAPFLFDGVVAEGTNGLEAARAYIAAKKPARRALKDKLAGKGRGEASTNLIGQVESAKSWQQARDAMAEWMRLQEAKAQADEEAGR